MLCVRTSTSAHFSVYITHTVYRNIYWGFCGKIFRIVSVAGVARSWSLNLCNHKSQWGETTHSRYWCSHFSLSVWINTEKAVADNTSTNSMEGCLRYDNSTNTRQWIMSCDAVIVVRMREKLSSCQQKTLFDQRGLCMLNVDTFIWKCMVLYFLINNRTTFLLWSM